MAHHSIVVIDNARPIFVDFGNSIMFSKFIFLRLAGWIENRALTVAAHTDSVAAVRSKSIGSAMVLLVISL